jgi:hypothetical protein
MESTAHTIHSHVGTDQLGIAGDPLFNHLGEQFGIARQGYVTHEGTNNNGPYAGPGPVDHTRIDLVYVNTDGYREIMTDIPIYMIGVMTVGGPTAWTFPTQCCEECSDRALMFAGWVDGMKRMDGQVIFEDGTLPLAGFRD